MTLTYFSRSLLDLSAKFKPKLACVPHRLNCSMHGSDDGWVDISVFVSPAKHGRPGDYISVGIVVSLVTLEVSDQ